MHQLLGMVPTQATVMQMLFQVFQPGLRPVEKVDQANQPKTVSLIKHAHKNNKPNQPETGHLNRTQP